ncbi:hypothetical protein JCM19379_16650 [Methyloparacoccus murrellii]
MIVFAGRSGRFRHPQAARHAKMDYQTPLPYPDQQVFPAPLQGMDFLALQALGQIRRDRPAQTRLANLKRVDQVTVQVRPNTSECRFDFGQLRHGGHGRFSAEDVA